MRKARTLLVALVLLGASAITGQAQTEPGRPVGSRVVQLLEESGYRYTKETPWLWALLFTGTRMPRVSVWVMTNDEEVIIESVIANRAQVVREPEAMRQLLVMNGTRNGMTFLVDKEGNYLARSRWILEQLDGPLFQASIQAIIAATDEAYANIRDYIDHEAAIPGDIGTPIIGLPVGATAHLDMLGGQASLSFNPLIWRETRSPEAGKRVFQHANGESFAMVVAERINVPSGRLRDRALANMRRTASDVRVIEEQHRRVNGTDVIALQAEVSVQGVRFIYLGYYYGGSAGTLQVVTYMERARFEASRLVCEEFLNGLRVTPER
jgi:hypothetical protein